MRAAVLPTEVKGRQGGKDTLFSKLFFFEKIRSGKSSKYTLAVEVLQ